jgi:hypothetical protein
VAKTKTTRKQIPLPQAPKPKLGNKDKYYSHVFPRLATIVAWKRHGLTDAEISENLGVTPQSICAYKLKHPELVEALKGGKDDSIAQVENALFRRAVGYEYVETKKITEQVVVEGRILKGKNGKPLTTTRVEEFRKQQAPDTTAQIFFLTNRFSAQWRHKNVLEHSGPDGQPLPAGTIAFYLPEKKPVETTSGANAT